MPRHQQVTTCRKSEGPVSKHCSCEHCCLAVCSVCGGAEGSLTTDCPGTLVGADRQREIYETSLDYTDDQGWHLGTERRSPRSPRFARAEVPPAPPRDDPRAVIAPAIDWTTIDRHADLQRDLALKAIAWVLAERDCEDRSAALVQDARDGRTDRKDKDVDFKLACKRAETADNEFRQVARRIVDALEQRPSSALQ